jgi:uncharacterized protein YeaO (DUF488 family)
MKGSILTRRWNDPATPEDGTRILICRYRPRALPKSDETWTEWIPDLAPSKELHAAFWGKGRAPITWETYRRLYLQEMRKHQDAIGSLADRVAAGATVTLLCSSACTRESRCHRSLLKDLLESALTAKA